MYRLIIFSVGFFLISSCGFENNESLLKSPLTKARSEYISTCFEITPGGQSYKDVCTCGFDRGIASLTSDEVTGYLRDFSEIQDLQYAFTVPAKFIEAQTECAVEAFE